MEIEDMVRCSVCCAGPYPFLLVYDLTDFVIAFSGESAIMYTQCYAETVILYS